MGVPTLLKFKNVAIGVGVATLAGLAVTAETGQRRPSVGSVSMVGNAPTITVVAGPTATPDAGFAEIGGLSPFLLRSLSIAPGLPDTAPIENDLTPTLVWQETAQPTKATLSMGGLAPATVGDGGQRINAGTGAAVIAGLAPTLQLPTGQSGTVDVARIAYEFLGREPSLALELTIPLAAPDAFSIIGLAPTTSVQVGWEDVPVAETPSWTDVPRV